jgi:hypothetical protein
VLMPSSFLSRSPLCGPTPFRYSIGESNMEANWLMRHLLVQKQKYTNAVYLAALSTANTVFKFSFLAAFITVTMLSASAFLSALITTVGSASCA